MGQVKVVNFGEKPAKCSTISVRNLVIAIRQLAEKQSVDFDKIRNSHQ
jgi:hypothetical protein